MRTTGSRQEEAAKESEADRLLELAGAINRVRGRKNQSDCYTERQLRDHRRREYSNTDNSYAKLYAIAEYELAELRDNEILSLAARARLTLEEDCAWRLAFIEGLDSDQIAQRLGIAPLLAETLLAAAWRRITNAMVLCPWWGWWEVYWSDVHRR